MKQLVVGGVAAEQNLYTFSGAILRDGFPASFHQPTHSVFSRRSYGGESAALAVFCGLGGHTQRSLGEPVVTGTRRAGVGDSASLLLACSGHH